MNERIKQLAERAEQTFGGTFTFNGGEVSMINLEKFTELIVKECIRNYRLKHGEYIRTGRHIDEYEHANNMLTKLGFKEHFGVEE